MKTVKSGQETSETQPKNAIGTSGKGQLWKEQSKREQL